MNPTPFIAGGHFLPRLLLLLLLLIPLLFPVPGLGEESAATEPVSAAKGRKVRALLIPNRESVLSAEIAARILSIHVDAGERFKRGQPLVRLDCGLYHAHLDKAKAELTEAEKTLEVNQRLEGLGSISELEVAVAAANVDKAKAEVSLHRIQAGKCVIRAPFDGRVVKREAHPHEFVEPGMPLLEILDNRDLDLQIYVPSGWLKWIQPTTRFQVHIDEVGKDYTAQVHILGAKVDPVSQTLEIRARIDGHHPELLAGMSGTASF